MLILALLACGLWLGVLLAPWRPWDCAPRLEADDEGRAGRGDITIVIPARNEAGVIGRTLRALDAAAPGMPVVVVDDQSTDGTADVVRRLGLSACVLLEGTPLPAGWTGKLWALQQGLTQVRTQWVLLLDADIQLAPGMLAALECKAAEGCALVSLCAEPCWQGWATRWLMPAFVYFFKLLYPFALANRADSNVAAAAGGVVLIQRDALLAAGGFNAWRDALIDDCTLAAHVKRAGHRTFIGLTHGATSLRHTTLAGMARMIARTAFVQLHESWWCLLAVSAVMALAFWVPVAAASVGAGMTRIAGVVAWGLLAGCHVPILRYYRRGLWLALVLPFTATFFLAMTWYSAGRSLVGTRSTWKGRRYAHRVRQADDEPET